jgi:hypothetical protein
VPLIPEIQQNLGGARLRFTLKDGNCNVVPNTLIDLAIFSYGGGVLANPAWMILEQKATPTTDASGIVDISYTGSASIGDLVYVTVILPTFPPAQSATWTLVIS